MTSRTERDAGMSTELVQALNSNGISSKVRVCILKALSEINDPNIAAVIATILNRTLAAGITAAPPNKPLNPRLGYVLDQSIEDVQRVLRATLADQPIKEFKQVTPAPQAADIVETAYATEKAGFERNEKRVSKLARHISELINTTSENQENTDRVALECAISLLHKKRPTFADLYASIRERIEDIHVEQLRRTVQANNKLKACLDETFSIGENSDPSEAFRHLYKTRAAHRTIAAARVWDELSDTQACTDTDEITAIIQKIAQYEGGVERLDIDANKIAEDLFRINGSNQFAFSLHTSVIEVSGIKKLTQLAISAPFNPESLHIALSAITKLEIMHKLLLAKDLKLEHLPTISGHLAKRFRLMMKRYHNDLVLNPPDGSHNLDFSPHHLVIDRPVKVDERGKSLISIIEKLFKKALPIATDIRDTVRFTIHAPEEITYSKNGKLNKDSLKKWCTHALGIIISEFGNDIDIKRIRSTILSGGSNPQSTGKHRGVHITFTLKYRIPENGLRPDGKHKVATVQVEGQFLGYMTKEDIKEDHRIYAANKRNTTLNAIGAGLSFQDLVEDFICVINSGHPISHARTLTSERSILEKHIDSNVLEYFDCQEGIGNLSNAPERVNIPKLLESGIVNLNEKNEHIVLTFLEILTRLNPNGDLVNMATLNSIKSNQKAALISALETCLTWPTTYPHSKVAAVIEQRARLVLSTIGHNRGSKTITRKIIILKSGKTTTHHLRSSATDAVDKANIDSLYSGPIMQTRVVKCGEEKHFFEKYVDNGKTKAKKLRYIIKSSSDNPHFPVCYLIDDSGKKLPIWYVDFMPDNSSGTNGHYIIHRYKHEIDRNPHNKPTLQVVEILDDYKNITNSQFNSLKPTDGMDAENRRRYTLSETFQARKQI